MSVMNGILKISTEPNQILANRSRPYNPTDYSKIYQNISVVKRLSNTRFPVYLVFSKITKEHFVMKMFPYIDEEPNRYFYNEARFKVLSHPNIIKFLYCKRERLTVHKGQTQKASYILIEYAHFGDFFNFVTKYRAQIDDKLARTYFRQLIDGIEYLHNNGVAHLDLKPENLLIGEDFNLKITDFDMSFVQGDPEVLSNGTKYYRPPEFFGGSTVNNRLEDLFAVDIYSAGIVMFILKSGGIYPHAENDNLEGNFLELMYKDNIRFWEKHCEIQNRKSSFFDSDFKELFNSMVKENPDQRATIEQIRNSKWYNGQVYSYIELCDKVKEVLNPQEDFE